MVGGMGGGGGGLLVGMGFAVVDSDDPTSVEFVVVE